VDFSSSRVIANEGRNHFAVCVHVVARVVGEGVQITFTYNISGENCEFSQKNNVISYITIFK